MKYLLRHGAKVNAQVQSNFIFTPLSRASAGGKDRAVALLLDHGAVPPRHQPWKLGDDHIIQPAGTVVMPYIERGYTFDYLNDFTGKSFDVLAELDYDMALLSLIFPR